METITYFSQRRVKVLQMRSTGFFSLKMTHYHTRNVKFAKFTA